MSLDAVRLGAVRMGAERPAEDVADIAGNGHPTLYVFALSHYCEKARWALDHFGIAYQVTYSMPGMNRRTAKRLGARRGSLPFLSTTDGVIVGSAAVIDWGEPRRGADRPSLSGEDADAALACEARLDERIGVHVRRYYYSEALLTDPKSVRPIFARDLALLPRVALTLGWTRIVAGMIRIMDLGPEQGRESQAIVQFELDWLDGLLADGRPYLTGDTFSRADITAASLLAPFVNPPQHPTYAHLALPPAIVATVAEWQARPSLKWVRRIYAEHR